MKAKSKKTPRTASAWADTEWDDLRIFLACCEARSFTLAARRLRIGQATVSRRIAALEGRLRQQLFDRRQGGLVATAAGELLQPYVESIANAVAGAGAALEGFEVAAEGDVRIAASPGIAAEILPALVMELRRRHPGIVLHVMTDPDARDVRRREVDIAVRTTTPAAGADLLVRRLTEVEFTFFASPAVARSLGPRPKISELDLIGWGGALAGLPQAVWLAAHAPHGFVVTTDTTVSMSALARHGAGVAFLPRLIGTIGGLVALPIAAAAGAPRLPLTLVVHRALRQVPRIAVVVDLMLETLERSSKNG